MRIQVIDHCDDCKYFDNEYYSYEEKCRLLERVIQGKEVEREGECNPGEIFPIPEDCPLALSIEKDAIFNPPYPKYVPPEWDESEDEPTAKTTAKTVCTTSG